LFLAAVLKAVASKTPIDTAAAKSATNNARKNCNINQKQLIYS
jgi:hypothetical protein